jgi:hypothetical protein
MLVEDRTRQRGSAATRGMEQAMRRSLDVRCGCDSVTLTDPSLELDY